MVGQCHGQRIHLGRERCVTVSIQWSIQPNQWVLWSYAMWIMLCGLSYVDGCYLQNITCTYPGKSAAATPSSGKQLSCSPAFPPLLHSQRGLAKKREPLANLPTLCNLWLQSCQFLLYLRHCLNWNRVKGRSHDRKGVPGNLLGSFLFELPVVSYCSAQIFDMIII